MGHSDFSQSESEYGTITPELKTQLTLIVGIVSEKLCCRLRARFLTSNILKVIVAWELNRRAHYTKLLLTKLCGTRTQTPLFLHLLISAL